MTRPSLSLRRYHRRMPGTSARFSLDAHRSVVGEPAENWHRGRASSNCFIRSSVAGRPSGPMAPIPGERRRRIETERYDALALVRNLPAMIKGWVLVRTEVKRWRKFGRKWCRYWAELRGGVVLLYDHRSSGQVAMVFSLLDAVVDNSRWGRWASLRNVGVSPYCLRILMRNMKGIVLKFDDVPTRNQWASVLFEGTTKRRPARFRDFDMIRPIGKGASGKVFLVKDLRTGNYLALKVVDKNRAFRNQLTFKHVVNERLILELCSGSPFLVELRYAFQTTTHLYLATDFYDGGDLYSLLRAYGGRLNERVARRVFAEVILALETLHSKNIVYRDLKPENVVLDTNGHIRLADFGLAKKLEHVESHLTRTVCGTSAYAAPEMLRHQPYSKSLDMWCLGIFMYHCLMGRPPWNMREKCFSEMLDYMSTNPIEFRSSISDSARHLIQELLVSDPRHRLTLPAIKRHPFFNGLNWNSIADKERHRDNIGPVNLGRICTGKEPNSDDDGPLCSNELNRWLLRNFDQEEWRHVSFTFDSEEPLGCHFPPFFTGKTEDLETSTIAGWSWVAYSPNGRSSGPRRTPRDFGRASVQDSSNRRRSLYRLRTAILRPSRRSLQF